MTSVSDGHIILTPTQPVGIERPQRESNPGPPHQESRALPTELPAPRSLFTLCIARHYIFMRKSPRDIGFVHIFHVITEVFLHLPQLQKWAGCTGIHKNGVMFPYSLKRILYEIKDYISSCSGDCC